MDEATSIKRYFSKQHLVPFLILLALLAGQFIMLWATGFEAQVMGDEHYYVGKAKYVRQHGAFPRTSGLDKKVIEGEAFSFSDYRPPGYPAFLSLLMMGGTQENNVSVLRKKAAIVQLLLMSSVLIAIYFATAASINESNWLYAVALLLGLQPWTFSCIKVLLPDSLSAFFATAGVVSLIPFITSPKYLTECFSLTTATGLLSTSFLFRAEMIVLVPVVITSAAVLKCRRPLNLVKYAFPAALVFLMFVSINVWYRFYVDGQFAIFGKVVHQSPGVARWTETWANSERQRLNIQWFFKAGKIDFGDIPEYAFADEKERKLIKGAFQLQEEYGEYNKEIDRIFHAVADKRIRENFIVNHVLTKLLYTCQLWINVNTNWQLGQAIAPLPREIRRGILGGLLLLKIIVIFLALVSGGFVWRHYRASRVDWVDSLSLVMLVFFFARTLLNGTMSYTIGPGFMESRYVLSAWPAVLWCAIYGGYGMKVAYF